MNNFYYFVVNNFLANSSCYKENFWDKTEYERC